MSVTVFLAIVGAVLLAIALYDVLQRQHAILRAFPIVGHFRYLLEEVGPELRQYIITPNTEEKPFSRYQRRWIYASSKRQNNYFGFGTDQEVDGSPNYLIIKHSTFPERAPRIGDRDFDPAYRMPAAKVLGVARGRRLAFRPASAVNISGMSFGALSGNASAALNEGAALAGCLHNTGEGGVSPDHLRGGELIWQLGSGYFGARTAEGSFDLELVRATVAAEHPVRAIEIKLSQGAQPGIGGTLPAAKVTPRIARARGVPASVDCVSPPRHPEFLDVDSMLDFVERVAEATGCRWASSPPWATAPSGSSSPSAWPASPAGSTTAWSSSGRASSVSPNPHCSGSRSAATW